MSKLNLYLIKDRADLGYFKLAPRPRTQPHLSLIGVCGNDRMRGVCYGVSDRSDLEGPFVAVLHAHIDGVTRGRIEHYHYDPATGDGSAPHRHDAARPTCPYCAEPIASNEFGEQELGYHRPCKPPQEVTR